MAGGSGPRVGGQIGGCRVLAGSYSQAGWNPPPTPCEQEAWAPSLFGQLRRRRFGRGFNGGCPRLRLKSFTGFVFSPESSRDVLLPRACLGHAERIMGRFAKRPNQIDVAALEQNFSPCNSKTPTAFVRLWHSRGICLYLLQPLNWPPFPKQLGVG